MLNNNNKSNEKYDENILIKNNEINNQLENEHTLEHIPENINNTINEDDKITCNHYIKEDCLEGFITNTDEIAQLKRKQQIDILKNCLLGDFDEEGRYSLAPEIINELKNVKKEVIEQYKTYLFLHTVYPIKDFGNISFIVSVSKQSNGDLKAKLILLEKVEKINGYIVDTISAEVNEFIDSPSTNYYNEMKKAFNIVEVDHKDIENEEDLKYCSLRKKELSNLWKNVNKQINKIEKEVFENKIKALESMKDNQFAQKLLDKFNEEKSKIEKSFIEDNSQKYIALNTLLDSCFDMLKGENLKQEILVATTLINAEKIAVDLQNIIVKEYAGFNYPNNSASFEGIIHQEREKQTNKQTQQQKENKEKVILLGGELGTLGYTKNETNDKTQTKPGEKVGTTAKTNNVETILGDGIEENNKTKNDKEMTL